MIVEDGTGLTNSVSYCSVAFANAYFTERGIITWTGSDAVKEFALIKATDYIELVYSQRFKGTKLTETQALSFPRLINDVVVSLPLKIQKATSELALVALTSPLFTEFKLSDTGYPLKRLKTEVGPIKEDTEYETGGNSNNSIKLEVYPQADLYLLEYLTSSSRVIRA